MCGSHGPDKNGNHAIHNCNAHRCAGPRKFSEIERIKVRLFEDNTRDIFAGKLVTITGNLHVIRENDNPNNKLVTVLYAQSIKMLENNSKS